MACLHNPSSSRSNSRQPRNPIPFGRFHYRRRRRETHLLNLSFSPPRRCSTTRGSAPSTPQCTTPAPMDFASIQGAPRSSLRYSATHSARRVPALQAMAFPMGSWGLVAPALWSRPPGQRRWTSGGCLRYGGPVQGQRQKEENLRGCPRHY
uniref:Uncharacterized protein n=1 Tax=Arundo donax TaxID=35708 RepID=A0A0A9DSY8_ARUDO